MVGVKVLRSSPVACAVTRCGYQANGNLEAGGFPRSGNSPPTLRRSPSPKVWRVLWDAVGSRLGPRRRCRGHGRPTYPGRAFSSRRADQILRRPASSAGSIRPKLSPRLRRCWGRAPTSAHSAYRRVCGGRHGWAGPLAAREVAPGGRCPSPQEIDSAHYSDPASCRWRAPDPQPRLRESCAPPLRSPPHSTRVPGNLGTFSEVGVAAHPASKRG